MTEVGGVHTLADLIDFARVYAGEAFIEEALKKQDEGKSIMDAIDRANRIFRFKVQEIEQGTLSALAKAFGRK